MSGNHHRSDRQSRSSAGGGGDLVRGGPAGRASPAAAPPVGGRRRRPAPGRPRRSGRRAGGAPTGRGTLNATSARDFTRARDRIDVVEPDPVVARLHAAADREGDPPVAPDAAGRDEALVEVEPHRGAGRGLAGHERRPPSSASTVTILISGRGGGADRPAGGSAGAGVACAAALRPARGSGAGAPWSGGSGFESRTVGLSGAVSATSGRVLPFSLTTIVTLSRERWRVPSGAIDCSTIWWEPGGSGGGTRAKRPEWSAAPRAWTWPLRRSSIVAPGRGAPGDDAVAVRLDPDHVEGRRAPARGAVRRGEPAAGAGWCRTDGLGRGACAGAARASGRSRGLRRGGLRPVGSARGRRRAARRPGDGPMQHAEQHSHHDRDAAAPMKR